MQKGEIQIYKTKTGAEIQVNLDNEPIWLDAHLIDRLFDINRPSRVKHIQNIYNSGELNERYILVNLAYLKTKNEQLVIEMPDTDESKLISTPARF